VKRLVLTLLGASVATSALVFAAFAPAQPPAPFKKTVVCHKTSSAKKPYKRIVVGTRAAMQAHMAHSADIVHAGMSVSAAPACPSQPLSVNGGGAKVSATLAPTAPNTVGSGTFMFRTNLGQGRLCFTLTVSGLTDVTAAHIHSFPVAPNNIVLPLPLAADFNTTGTTTQCISAARALIKAMLTNPAGYYVNVHTTAFPAGAIQGTLAR
jgi:hypothetical protein